MTTTTSTMSRGSAELVPVAETLFTDAERAALAGFLAGYSGLTRDAYTLDLLQYTCWCTQHGLHLFGARRADIECFGRDMESTVERGRPSPAVSVKSYAATRICRCRRRTPFYAADGGWVARRRRGRPSTRCSAD